MYLTKYLMIILCILKRLFITILLVLDALHYELAVVV